MLSTTVVGKRRIVGDGFASARASVPVIARKARKMSVRHESNTRRFFFNFLIVLLLSKKLAVK
jgi:hypothetical protein